MEAKQKKIFKRIVGLLFFIPPTILLYYLKTGQLWNRKLYYYVVFFLYGSLSIFYIIEIILLRKKKKSIWEDRELPVSYTHLASACLFHCPHNVVDALSLEGIYADLRELRYDLIHFAAGMHIEEHAERVTVGCDFFNLR